MDSNSWIHVIADAIVVSMIGYAIAIFKKLLEEVIKSNRHAHDRLTHTDRAISESIHQPFDSSAIARGYQAFPLIHKPRRDS